jgi:hypothetical protein
VRLVVTALVAALLLPATAGAKPVPKLRGVSISNIGTRSDLGDIDAELNAVQALGANTLRADISWAGLEPDQQGTLDAGYLERIDHLVAGAHKRHIKPVLIVLRSPCWASSAPKCDADAVAYPPKDPATYGAIAGRLAKRYKGRLAGFEVWNEPDHANQDYFKGPDKPARYAALVKAAYRAIKRVDHALPVVAGSLVGSNGAFLEALYRHGMQGFYDGLAVHYYDLTLASIRAIRRVQLKHADHTPLWLTEFGWTSCWPAKRTEGQHACVTAKQQAADLADIFRALRGRSFIRAAIVYNLRERPGEHFGLITAAGKHKPAFAAMQRAFRFGSGGPHHVTAHVRSGRLGGSAPAGDVVLVQGYRGKQFVYNAVLAPDRFGRFSLKLPGALRGARLEVFQEWTGLKTVVTA